MVVYLISENRRAARRVERLLRETAFGEDVRLLGAEEMNSLCCPTQAPAEGIILAAPRARRRLSEWVGPWVRALPLPLLVVEERRRPGREEEALRTGAAEYLTLETLTAPELEAAIRRALWRQEAVEHALFLAPLRQLLRQADVRFARISLEGHILDLNDASLAEFGCVREEVLGRPFLELLLPEDRERVAAAWRRLLTGPPDAIRETVRLTRADGSLRWIQVDAHLLRGADGRPQEVLALLEDVTEQQRITADMEHVLRGLRSLLWRLEVRSSGERIENWSLRLHLFNPEHARRVFPRLNPGEDPAELPWRLKEWIHPDDLESVEGMFRAALGAEPSRMTMEFRVCADEGDLRWLSSDVLVEPIGPGHWQMTGLTTDITDRKETEGRYHRQALLYEYMREAAILVDAEGTILEWNRGAEATFGYSRDEIVGRSADVLFDLPDPTIGQRVRRRILEGGYWEDEARFIRKDGTSGIAQISAVPVPDEGGRQVHILSIVRDVTAQREAERSLRESRERFELLHRIARGIHTDSTSQEVIAHTRRCLEESFPQYTTEYGLINGRNHYHRIPARPEEAPLELDLNLIPEYLKALRSFEPVVISNVPEDERIGPFREPLAAEGIFALLDIAIPHDADRIGRLSLESPEPHGWTEHEIQTLREVADYLGLALADALAREREQQAIEALRAALQRHETMMQVSPLGIVLIGADHQILEANPAAQTLLGMSEEALRARRGEFIITGKGRAEFIQAYRALWSGDQERFHQQVQIQRPDGKLLWLEIHGAAIPGPTGTPQAALLILNDVTERIRWERTLQESEERYRDLFENTNDLIFTFDPEGRFLFVNPAWSRTLGYDEEESRGLHLADIVHPDHWGALRRALEEAQSSGESVRVELDVVRKDGRVLTVEGDLFFRQQDGKPIQGRAILRDVTERRRIEALKSEFVSTASHELRTPLTSIRGAIDLILGGAAGEIGPEVRSLLQIAHNNCVRITRLINDILDLERIEEGRLAFEMQPLDIRTLVAEAVEQNTAFARQMSVTLRLERSVPNAIVLADHDRMIQVITNLLSNAIKFSPEGGVVRIHGALEEKFVRIGVTDQGPGIPPEDQQRIFERFAQSDHSQSRKKGGSGLGLSIAKAIVEKHQGRIWVESEVGKGATFYVELPLWEEESAGPGEEEASSPWANWSISSSTSTSRSASNGLVI
ncbi:MAG: hypothetical protein KatS3mg115_0677 [Candidatus Poribacteria bacterium]|nr:MAG: hypothetical protein KatS3mg115_0677 [Candidatus Poribacteria bacterium]